MARSLAVVALLAAAASALAPAARADFTVAAPEPVGPLMPGAETAEVVFHVTDDCQDLLARAGPGADEVRFSLQQQAVSSYVLLIGPTEGGLPLAPCLVGQPESSADVEWSVALKPDAPGLEALQADVLASLSNQPAAQPRESAVSFTVHGKAIFVLQADVENGKLRTTDGDRTTYRLNVTNWGNVKVLVGFAVTDAPGSGQVRLPEPVAVNTMQSGLGNQAEVEVTYVADGGVWDTDDLVLALTPTAFIDGAQAGAPFEVGLLARNGNVVERSAPAPALPLGLLAVAIAALAARRL